MRRRFESLAWTVRLLPLLFIVACGDAPPPVTGSLGTSAPPGDPASERGDAGGAAPPRPSASYEGTILCEGTPQLGADVAETRLEGKPPSGEGGTLTLGTYYLSELGVYVGDRGDDDDGPELGPTGAIERATLIVTADAIRRTGARVEAGPGPQEADLPDDAIQGFTYDAGPTTLELRATCPTAGPTKTVSFTASKARLTLHDGDRREIYVLAE